MFRSKTQEEKNQEIRELFVEMWKKSAQHEDINQDPLLVTHENATIKIWLEDNPFHLFMEITIANTWLIEKEEVDPEVIKGFLEGLKVE